MFWARVAVIVAAGAAVVALCSCSVPGAGGSGLTCTRPSTSKTRLSPGLNATGAARPAWSGRVGSIVAAEGERLFSDAGGSCLYELSALTGASGWSWSAPGHSLVMGAVASQDVVIVATGTYHGRAPAAVFAVTGRITGLDPGSGRQRWSMEVGDDGQGVPAGIYGDTAVVAEGNGAVVAVDASRGTPRWSVPAAGCRSRSGSPGPSPTAVLLPGAAGPTVAYRCAPAQRIVRLDPATGAAAWSWTLSPGRTVDVRTTAGGSGVLGVLVRGAGGPIAAERPPARQGAGQGDGYATDALVAVSGTTGKPQWEVDGIPSTAGVYAGPGRLCAVSAYASACYDSTTGAQSWARSAQVTPSRGGSGLFSAQADNGVLHVVEPTPEAVGIPPESTAYQSRPGAFALLGVDIATGRILSTTRLPAFSGGPDQVVVSADSPPGVVAVTRTRTIISAQFGETGTLEAFGN